MNNQKTLEIQTQNARTAMYNFGRACEPLVEQFRVVGCMIKEINERPDFQLLVISIKSPRQENPYHFFFWQLVIRFVKARHKDRRYWFELIRASIRDRKQLKVYFMLKGLRLKK